MKAGNVFDVGGQRPRMLPARECQQDGAQALCHRKRFPGRGFRGGIVTPKCDRKRQVSRRKQAVQSPKKGTLSQEFPCRNKYLRGCVMGKPREQRLQFLSGEVGLKEECAA